ncbi:WxL domain-containing protein [Enterococcus sp. HY326]|uniref:WxL domain-containing protein n=1 Tax=Enterococcus sp. HY326 TaxID=2971265 RepID=UPI00223FA8D1|nr:WxL domain-containing protein [Enterococcus sp. HY326]
MNKKFLFGFATVALGAAFVATTPVQAAADDTATKMTTDAGIGFSTFNPGPGPFYKNLALTFVPKSFQFGNANTASANAQTYKQTDAPSGGQYVGVSDDRDTKTAWNVSATLADFTSTTTSSNTLANAELSMVLSATQQFAMDGATADASGVPTPNSTTLTDFTDATLKALYSGTSSETVKLTAGGAGKTVMSYTLPTTGSAATGTAAVARTVSDVNLTVKGGSAKENNQYKSTVTWVLSDTGTDSPTA